MYNDYNSSNNNIIDYHVVSMCNLWGIKVIIIIIIIICPVHEVISLLLSRCLTSSPFAYTVVPFSRICVLTGFVCVCMFVEYFQRPEEEDMNSNQAADKEEEEELRNSGPTLSRQNSSKKLVSIFWKCVAGTLYPLGTAGTDHRSKVTGHCFTNTESILNIHKS